MPFCASCHHSCREYVGVCTKNTLGPFIYYVSIFLDFLDPPLPPSKHILCTENKQKLSFFNPHPQHPDTTSAYVICECYLFQLEGTLTHEGHSQMKAVFESSPEELLILHQRNVQNAYAVENIMCCILLINWQKFRIIQDSGCFIWV